VVGDILGLLKATSKPTDPDYNDILDVRWVVLGGVFSI
jgi:hypothetical protein